MMEDELRYDRDVAYIIHIGFASVGKSVDATLFEQVFKPPLSSHSFIFCICLPPSNLKLGIQRNQNFFQDRLFGPLVCSKVEFVLKFIFAITC